jgi:hypothetical protein
MNLCYIDESGTSAIPGNSTHFVLTAVAIPVFRWKQYDKDLYRIKSNFDLADAEIHTGWINRVYPEQNKIPDFEKLTYAQRKSNVQRLRNTELLRLHNIHYSNLDKP